MELTGYEFASKSDTLKRWSVLEAVQAATSGLVMVLNTNTRTFEWIGPSIHEYLGYDEAELLDGGTEFMLTLLHADDVDRLLTLAKDNLERRRSSTSLEPLIRTEHRLRHRDGSWRWFHTRAVQLDATQAGQVLRVLFISHDISERKCAEEALRRQERAFLTLVQTASDLITILDQDGKILFESPSIERFAGLPAGSRIGMSAFEAIHPHDRARVVRLFQEATERLGFTFSTEYRYRHVDGTWHWARSQSANQLHNPAVRGFVVTSSDITEQKKAAEYRQRVEMILAHASRMAGIGNFEVGRPGQASLWSDPHYQLWQRDPELGPPDLDELLQQVHDEDRQRLREAVETSLSTAEPFDVEYRVSLPDGTEHVFASKGGVIRDEDGVISRLVGATQDVTDRKRTEESLRKSEVKYRTLVESCPDVIMRFDRSMRHLFASAGVEPQTGIPASAFIGRTHRELGFPEYLCRIWDHELERTFTSGRPGSCRFVLPTGVVIEWRLFPEFAQDGSVETVLSFAQNVTELASRTEALEESERKFRELTDLLPQPVFELDHQGRIQFANQAAFSCSGHSPEELAGGITAVHVIARSDRRRGMRDFRAALVRPIQGTEYRIRRKDGTCFPALVYTAPIHRDGKEAGLRGIVVDISDRKRVEEALGISEAMYRALFENTGCASVVDEGDTTIVLANSEWERLTGVPKIEQEGLMSWLPFIHPDDRERLKRIHFARREREGAAPGTFEVRILGGDGIVHPMLCHVAAVPGRDRTVATLIDVTELRTAESERKDLQARLSQAEKLEAIGQLAGGIAHDFNNQLSAIQGFAEMIQERVQEDSIRHFAENIARSCQRTSSLTRQLLAFARKGKYLSAPVDLHKLIDELTQLLRHSIDKRITIVHELVAERATVTGDATQLQNALMNLAVNARDAMPHGGTLTFRTCQRSLEESECQALPYEVTPGAFLCLEILDTGCGMTDDVRQHLFEPFFTTKELGKGTGLGLASVYGAVKNHHGCIAVQSAAGRGTRFEICLPLASGEMDTTERSPLRSQKVNHERILVAEDEELIGELLVEMLRSAGFSPVLTRDGQEALDHYREHWRTYDLVILDMMMPNLGGRDAFREMRKINPAIKVLFASGFSQEGEAQSLLDEGALGFLPKPFKLHELRGTIEQVLGKA